jgi:hypothetical protein
MYAEVTKMQSSDKAIVHVLQLWWEFMGDERNSVQVYGGWAGMCGKQAVIVLTTYMEPIAGRNL